MEYVKKHGKEPRYKMNEQLERNFDKQFAMLQDEISTKLSLLSGKVFQVKKEDINDFFRERLVIEHKFKSNHKYGHIHTSVGIYPFPVLQHEEYSEEYGSIGVAGVIVMYTDDLCPVNYAFTELRIVRFIYDRNSQELLVDNVDFWEDEETLEIE